MLKLIYKDNPIGYNIRINSYNNGCYDGFIEAFNRLENFILAEKLLSKAKKQTPKNFTDVQQIAKKAIKEYKQNLGNK